MSTSKGAGWSRVVGEGVVIVISILLALSLDAWWEGRQEAQVRRELLVALRADFVATESRVANGLARAEELVAMAESFLAASDNPQTIPADSLRQLRVFNTVRLSPQLGAYRAATNSGELRLLRSDRLYSLLNEFEDGLLWWRTVYDVNAHMSLNGRMSAVMAEWGGEDRFYELRDLHDAMRRPEVRAVAWDFWLVHLNFRSSIGQLLQTARGIVEELDRLLDLT